MGCNSSKPKAEAPAPSLNTLLKDEFSKDTGASDAPNAGAPQLPTSGVSHGSGSSGTYHMRSHRVLTTERHELDIMVSQFISHDSTVGAAIGRNWIEKQWKVMYDLDATPVDIKLQVQEHKLHSHEVAIESMGQAIFSGAGSNAKAKMTEDFCYQWPFRASARGINEINFFEARPDRTNPYMWVPATITRQREDGFFEVTARQVDERGYAREAKYPAMHKDDLREASTQKPLMMSESSLVLKVPKSDPTHAQFSVENEIVTRHFGRPSPPPLRAGEKKPKIEFKVTKDRSKVEANVGHDVLSHFNSGEVRSIDSEVERLAHSWTAQLGPFAKHTIKVSKKQTLTKIISLVVDDDLFVEATAADLACTGNGWQCNFRFVGEKTLDFEVFKTNSDGAPLDQTAHVEEKRRYVHECSVFIPNDRDLTTAQFFIDGVDFRQLPMKPLCEEPTLSMNPAVMLQSYSIKVPYKVDMDAPSNFALLTNSILGVPAGTQQVATGFFASCCCANSVAPDSTEVQG